MSENTRLIFLNSNTWDFIWAGSFLMVNAFEKSWHFSGCERNNIKFVGPEKFGVGFPSSSNIELEAKIVVKSFALSDEHKINSGLFMIVDMDLLLLLRIWLENFQTARDPSRLLSTLDLTAYAELHFELSRTLLQLLSKLLRLTKDRKM